MAKTGLFPCFRLDGKTPVLCEPEELQFGVPVCDDTINGVRVSTVFLGIDHRHTSNGPPILFETMLFGGRWDQEVQERYATWDEAEAGHRRWCYLLRETEGDESSCKNP